jgi:hypothetical protein
VGEKSVPRSEYSLNRRIHTFGQALRVVRRFGVTGIRAGTSVLIALSLCSFTPQNRSSGSTTDPNAKAANALVEQLVADALALRETSGRTRVSIADGVITYDFRPVPAAALANRPDCLTGPLELLIRSAAIRRDFRALLVKETFWVAPLDRVDSLATSMVEAKYAVAGDEECRARQQQGKTAADAEFTKLEVALRAYAAKSGLGTVGTRGFPEAYRVEISIDPAKARIRFMPFLDYKRCLYFNLPLEERWNDLTPGTHNLIGRYHYRAEWPTALNGPEESNFDVTANTRITFTPKAN